MLDGSIRSGTLKYHAGYRVSTIGDGGQYTGTVEFVESGKVEAQELSAYDLLGFVMETDSFRAVEDIIYRREKVERDFVKIAFEGPITRYWYYRFDYSSASNTVTGNSIPVTVFTSDTPYILELEAYGLADRPKQLVVPSRSSIAKMYFGVFIKDYPELLQQFEGDRKWFRHIEEYVLPYNEWAKSQE